MNYGHILCRSLVTEHIRAAYRDLHTTTLSLLAIVNNFSLSTLILANDGITYTLGH